MEQIKLAVIGAGSMGVKHAHLISSHDRCTLAGICDTNPSLRSVADKFGVRFYTSPEELINKENPTGAIIATPNSLHASLAEVCANQKVHMLIEKPVADTIESAGNIVAITRSMGVKVLVGHHRRHSPLVQKVRELIREGSLGKLVGVSIIWALLKPDEYFKTVWRSRKPGGGPLLINLIHELDLVRFLCGEISEVYARKSSAIRGHEVEDSLNISICFESGAFGTSLASDVSPSPWSYELTTGENPLYYHAQESCYHFLGTSASLAFPAMELWRYPDKGLRGWQHNLEKVIYTVEPVDPLTVQLEHFCRVIEGKEEPVPDAEDAARSLIAALAVQKSAGN